MVGLRGLGGRQSPPPQACRLADESFAAGAESLELAQTFLPVAHAFFIKSLLYRNLELVNGLSGIDVSA